MDYFDQCLYCVLRSKMDFSNGFVGKNCFGKICYHTIAQHHMLYVEPKAGKRNTGAPTKRKLECAIARLQQQGLLSQNIAKGFNGIFRKNLIFHLPLSLSTHDKSISFKQRYNVFVKEADAVYQQKKQYEKDNLDKQGYMVVLLVASAMLQYEGKSSTKNHWIVLKSAIVDDATQEPITNNTPVNTYIDLTVFSWGKVQSWCKSWDSKEQHTNKKLDYFMKNAFGF